MSGAAYATPAAPTQETAARSGFHAASAAFRDAKATFKANYQERRAAAGPGFFKRAITTVRRLPGTMVLGLRTAKFKLETHVSNVVGSEKLAGHVERLGAQLQMDKWLHKNDDLKAFQKQAKSEEGIGTLRTGRNLGAVAAVASLGVAHVAPVTGALLFGANALNIHSLNQRIRGAQRNANTNTIVHALSTKEGPELATAMKQAEGLAQAGLIHVDQVASAYREAAGRLQGEAAPVATAPVNTPAAETQATAPVNTPAAETQAPAAVAAVAAGQPAAAKVAPRNMVIRSRNALGQYAAQYYTEGETPPALPAGSKLLNPDEPLGHPSLVKAVKAPAQIAPAKPEKIAATKPEMVSTTSTTKAAAPKTIVMFRNAKGEMDSRRLPAGSTVTGSFVEKAPAAASNKAPARTKNASKTKQADPVPSDDDDLAMIAPTPAKAKTGRSR
jgi:hypothetical protein